MEMEKAHNGGARLRGKSLEIQSHVSVLVEEWVECETWTQPVQVALAAWEGSRQMDQFLEEELGRGQGIMLLFLR